MRNIDYESVGRSFLDRATTLDKMLIPLVRSALLSGQPQAVQWYLMMNLPFSVELHLKALIYLTASHDKCKICSKGRKRVLNALKKERSKRPAVQTHDLRKLFQFLPQETQDYIGRRYSRGLKEFDMRDGRFNMVADHVSCKQFLIRHRNDYQTYRYMEEVEDMYFIETHKTQMSYGHVLYGIACWTADDHFGIKKIDADWQKKKFLSDIQSQTESNQRSKNDTEHEQQNARHNG